MWAAITAGLSLFGTLFGYFISGKKSEQEKDQAYLNFIEASSNTFTNSAKLKSSYDAQKLRMEEKRKKRAEAQNQPTEEENS